MRRRRSRGSIRRERSVREMWIWIAMGAAVGALVGALLPVELRAASIYLCALFGALAGWVGWKRM